MSLCKKSLFLFCAGFLGLAHANTSFVTAVLLNEDGSPRCRIETEDSVLGGPEAEQVADEWSALEVCDRGMILDSEEIQMGAVSPGVRGVISTVLVGLNAVISCAVGMANAREEGDKGWFFGSGGHDSAARGAIFAIAQEAVLEFFDKAAASKSYFKVSTGLAIAQISVGASAAILCYVIN